MICPGKIKRIVKPEDLVTEVLRETTTKAITVDLVNSPQEEDRWNKLIGEWIGLLGWSSAAFHLGPRDAWIGWTDAQRHDGRHLVACNARFALLTPKGRWPNLASRSLSLNLQRLSADWLERYGHPILLVETYVDPQRFEGTCYRAA